MKQKTYSNVVKAIRIIQKKRYNFEDANKMAIRLFDEHTKEINSIEFYIDKIQEKTITVAERIQYGKANHQITHIYLRDANTREKIGVFKDEEEIPTEILYKSSRDDWDRSYGWLTINVK